MSEKKKRGRRRKPSVFRAFRIGVGWAFGVLLCCTIIVLTFSPYSFDIQLYDTHLDIHPDEYEAESQIRDSLRLELAESSQEIFFFQSGWQDDWFPAARIRFTAPSGEVLIWLQNPDFCFGDPLPQERVFTHENEAYPDHDWWNPYLMEDFIGDTCYDMEHSFPYAYHLIQIDTSNPEYWTVYFEFWYN